MLDKSIRYKQKLPSKIHFQVISRLKKTISTTKGYWNIIINIKHPAVKGRESEVKETLTSPEQIRQNNKNKKIYLFYKKYSKRYLCVIVRHLNGNGFIITVYFTNKIKEGKQIWQEK